MAKNQCTLPDPNKGNGRTGWEMVQMQLISVQNQWNFAQTRWTFKDADFRFYKRQETRKCARFLLLPLRLLQASILEDAEVVPDLGSKMYVPCGSGPGVWAVRGLLLSGFSNTPSPQAFLTRLINSSAVPISSTVSKVITSSVAMFFSEIPAIACKTQTTTSACSVQWKFAASSLQIKAAPYLGFSYGVFLDLFLSWIHRSMSATQKCYDPISLPLESYDQALTLE